MSRLALLVFWTVSGASGWARAEGCDDALRARRAFAAHLRLPDAPVAVAILDADDTLRTSKSRPGRAFVDDVDDVLILPGVPERLRELRAAGYVNVIMSNQGGVPKYRTLAQIDEVFHATLDLLAKAGAPIDYYDFAERYDDDRKPGVGMITRLEEALRTRFGSNARLDRARSLVVGDAGWTADETRADGRPGVDRSNSDRLLAENAGLRFHYAVEFFARPFDGGRTLAPADRR